VEILKKTPGRNPAVLDSILFNTDFAFHPRLNEKSSFKTQKRSKIEKPKKKNNTSKYNAETSFKHIV